MNIGRVSTLQLNQTNRQFVMRSTSALQNASQELTTGRRSDVFADHGMSATASLALRSRLAKTETYNVNNSLLEGRLQVQLNSLETIRSQVLGVMEVVLANSSSPTAGAETLQLQARNALEVVISQLNVSLNGEALFSGTMSDIQPLTPFAKVNAQTGLSPEQIINAIISAPPSSIADVNAIGIELDQVFSSTSANSGWNYEETFYSGTPEFDVNGLPSKRVSALIEPGFELEYGLQANDEPFRQIIKGLSMLAAADVSKISQPEVYVAWMEQVSTTLGNAYSKTLMVSAEIGFRQQTLESAQQRLEAGRQVQQSQLAALENADPYEAATRMKSLETQLRMSYEVTAQLTSLSILNYF